MTERVEDKPDDPGDDLVAEGTMSTDDPRYDFLKTEYTQCLELVKFYDNRQQELVKFASGLSAAVPTAVLAFRAATSTLSSSVWSFTALVAIVTGVSLLTIFTALVQNRLYFVYPARQANAIRKLLLPRSVLQPNHMYPNYSVPAFKLLSSQTLQYAFVALQLGSFFGIASYGLRHDQTSSALTCAIWVAIGASVLAVVAAWLYLSIEGDKDPLQPV